jgi:hypothetical protein
MKFMWAFRPAKPSTIWPESAYGVRKTLIPPDTGIQLDGIDDSIWGFMDRTFTIRHI